MQVHFMKLKKSLSNRQKTKIWYGTTNCWNVIFSEKEALERTEGAAGERYKRFLKKFAWDYQNRYREENGRTYSADHGKRTVFNADERNELQKEYKEYVAKLLQD